MLSRSLGHRAPLLWIVLPFIAGLAAADIGEFASVRTLLAISVVASAVTLLASARHPRIWAPSLCAAMVSAGAASYTIHRARLPAWEGLPPREVRLSLEVTHVFPPADPKRAAGFARVAHTDEHLHELAGQRIYFSLTLRKGERPPVRSAVISVLGVIAALPRHPPTDSFESYLSSAGMNFRLSRGRVLVTERAPAAYYTFLERAAEKLNAWLSEGVARKRPALTAVFRAMMLGQKNELSEDQRALFMQSGTMHLFAINGLHIGVVAMALHALLAVLRCPRPLASLLTLAVLWLDVDTTGASPSAVRAFILIACYEIAFVSHRPANGIAALTTAAFIVLLLQPMALFSASFQMSYGVVFAILSFGLPLADAMAARFAVFRNLPEPAWSWWQRTVARALRWFWPVLGIGLAAALVSTISGPEFFQVWAPGGLVSNLVLVPIAMLVIIAGFASVVAGLIGLTLVGSLFNHAAMVLLVIIDWLIRLGAHTPGMWWPANWRVAWAAPAALALLLAALLSGYAVGWRKERGGWWPPFAIATCALILGVKFG